MSKDDQPVTQSDFGALVQRVAALERTSQENSAGIEHIRKNTDELVKVFRAAKGAYTVWEFLGRAARPLLWIGAACAAFWIFLKTGEWPRS